MNKMLVAVFKDEPAAYEGLKALKELHTDGEISLYATAVLVKDASGAVNVKQSADQGPVGSALGMLTGSLVGLLAGPVGALAGASLGGMTGAITDLNKSGVNIEFLDDVSKSLSPGKAAVLADAEESWTTPVDTRIGKLGGVVFRRQRSEVIEDQLVRENAESEAELQQLQNELKAASAEDKAAMQKEIDSVKSKIETIHTQAKTKATELKTAADAKAASLRQQTQQASTKRKEKVEKRIEEVKADLHARMAKLHQAEGASGTA